MFSSETLEIFNNTSGRLLLNCLNLKKETFSDRSFRGFPKLRNLYFVEKNFRRCQFCKLLRVISFQDVEIKKNKINFYVTVLFLCLYYGFNNSENYNYYFYNNIISVYNVQKKSMFDIFDDFDDEERLFFIENNFRLHHFYFNFHFK